MTDTNVTKFLETIEHNKRRTDAIKLSKLMESLTGVSPVLWSGNIVGFGNHHYKYETGREGDTVAVGFSPRKAALVLYGVVYYEQNVDLLAKLGGATSGKGCLYIKDLSKIDHAVLRDMIDVAFKARNDKS